MHRTVLLVGLLTIAVMSHIFAEESSAPTARGEELLTANCARCLPIGDNKI